MYPKVSLAGAFEKSAGHRSGLQLAPKRGSAWPTGTCCLRKGWASCCPASMAYQSRAEAGRRPCPSCPAHLSQGRTKTHSPQAPPMSRQTWAVESIAGSTAGSSQSPGGAVPGARSLYAEVKQEPTAEASDTPTDILSFLKNCNSHDLATLYHRWGSTNPLLDHTGALRSLMRQGDYICRECGKSFSQPSHLRTHMRSHTVLFESNGLRGTDVHPTPAEVPKQVRDRSGASSAHTARLRKGT
ncbi:hypothetical protein AAFF_G00163750 [Aldrovandia affinis]|uniref:C2H2-type domain-containing protein n=1 Tax=Aldrovandia affinis TaxID=143900 RepID=A0AAD7WW90_9TELE|nr:hypothetical protein AAFF_G00163750 [Aldrovandia affinis]